MSWRGESRGSRLGGDYMTYNDIARAALVSVCWRTPAMNDMNRKSARMPQPSIVPVDRAFCVGLVGARFEVPGEMEYRFIIVDREQNKQANGYGTGGSEWR